MDEIAEYNKARWKALVEADALFTRPKFDLDYDSAKDLVNPNNRFGEVKGKEILCLASGGGKQSAAFALLGANVTVFDISEEQLERDRLAAEHYEIEIKTVQGDMRNLSDFERGAFDIVYHPYSINFVPDSTEVFEQIAKVIKTDGIYYFSFANPFTMGISQIDWYGEGYLLKKPYVSKAEIIYDDQNWVYDKTENEPIPRPKEYRHTLSELINGLIDLDFLIRNVSDNEDMHPDLKSEPASWDHFVAFAPPWLSVLAVYKPDLEF